MNSKLAKSRLVPYAVFLALCGYLTWPFIDPPAPSVSTQEKPLVIDKKWLNPSLEAAATRDPFTDLTIRPAPAPPSQAPRASGATGGQHAKAGTVLSKPKARVDGLVLGGTIARGARRAAIINGRVFRQGDPLEDPGFPTAKWILEQVEAETVVLVNQTDGSRHLLNFERRAMTETTMPADSLAVETLPPELSGLPGGMASLARLSGNNLATTYANLLRLVIDPSSRQKLLGAGKLTDLTGGGQ